MNTEETSKYFDRKLTLGAQRILERFHLRVNELQVSGASPFRLLLQELFHEENQATERVGLRQEIVATIEIIDTDDDQTQSLKLIDWQTVLLRHADRYAIQSSAEAITGTEHLLLAALELDDWTRSFFVNHGVRLDDLTAEICPPEPKLPIGNSEPILVKPAGVGAIDEPTLHRILDASANRCREGLRVVEDFVRFGLNDSFLSRSLKELRHQITATLKYLGQEKWVSSRDTTHDVGTATTTQSEVFRGTPVDVVRASMKRTEEALRSLEEFSKLIDPDLSGRLEQSRYLFYTIEKAIETNLNSRERLANRRLYLLVSIDNCRYGIETTVRDTIAKGVEIVQLREKSLSDRQLIDLAKHLREWTYEHDALLIVNDRPDIAIACGADGVHLGQDDMAIHEARKIAGSRMLIGMSTHNIDQAREAIFSGADYLGVGPTFPSKTKAFDEFSGLEFVQEVAESTSLPWFAIGGIDLSNLGQVTAAGATRIAVSSTLCSAADPRGVATELADRLALKQ